MGFARDKREELGDFFLAHLCRMVIVMEEDESFDPLDIGTS
jgi:hypothetical protein